ncbi:UNVERIFIED_CONTAM: hypothetical protein PYX00_005928 [Menopon gallinae]|uniref:6-phosphogluconate dehydrogenase NADP-binding domain-containing protein n=1 Tax=Menopon gallinae TaxID=328185 RepID=A0AAW2HTE4_9NEOP
MHCIYFFGSNNYAWIEESQIKPYEEFKEQFGKAAKTSLKEAIDAIEDYINNKGGEDIFATVPDPEAEFNKLKESTLENEQKEDKEKKKEKKENQTPKEIKAKKPKIQKDSLLKKRKEGRLLTSSPLMKKSRKELEDSESNDTILLNHTSSIRKSCAPGLLQRPSANFMVSSQQLDLESVSQTLKDKNILPSKLKFGFLGLGIMGSGIVKNLLNSGHSVVVWNRTTDKVSARFHFINSSGFRLRNGSGTRETIRRDVN